MQPVSKQRLGKHISAFAVPSATIEILWSLCRMLIREVNAVTELDPCGGGVEYLHRDPASRRRRRKGKSQI
jgi:hypothetical protein